jgi:hypothetical protein
MPPRTRIPASLRFNSNDSAFYVKAGPKGTRQHEFESNFLRVADQPDTFPPRDRAELRL